MGKFLALATRVDLIERHKKERDKYVCDRLKAVLAYDEGHSPEQIASILLLKDEETVRRHIREYQRLGKLKPENGGSASKLTEEQRQSLEAHLEGHVYARVQELINYIQATYGIAYTVSGMTKWLKQHRFVYKQPKAVPAKADRERQTQFIEAYQQLKALTPAEEPIVFIDAVHPTMATKIAYGWIRKGKAQPIHSIASRTRVNLMGAIELATLKSVVMPFDHVNGQTTCEFLAILKKTYPKAPKLHVILDQSGYHRSEVVQAFAKRHAVELHYLPPYSPNLNPIERLWKVMNECVRNNQVFSSPKSFRHALIQFFEHQLPLMTQILKARLNDNFQTLPTTS
jgi:transposase